MEGIEWRHTDAFLDEIPGAYKDIDTVMADAADLVVRLEATIGPEADNSQPLRVLVAALA